MNEDHIPVENHVDPLVSDGRVNDGPLAAVLHFDCHLVALILICNQRRNVGLDAASTETNNNDCGGEATQRCTALDRGG
jgi:hypothetical protein